MARPEKLPTGLRRRGDTYYACFRAGGRLRQEKLSRDRKTAELLLRDMRARADRGDFGLLDNNELLGSLRDQYVRFCETTCRPGTVTRYKLSLRNVLGGVNATKVSQLSVDGLTTYRIDRKKTGESPRTINHDVGVLSAMLNWAVAHDLIGSNPLTKLKPLPTDGDKRKDRRALSVEEIESLFAESPEWMLPVWRMFAVTGMRRSELCNLKFSDVDFDRGVVIVRAKTAKTKREREIPLDDEILAIITRLRDDAPFRRPGKGNTAKDTAIIERQFSKQHVFVTSANTPWKHNLLKRFYAICKRAKIDGAHQGGSVDLHSLRVTFTTLTLENGAAPDAVRRILGHATLAMTMSVYAKTTERGMRAAVSVLPFANVSNPKGIVSLPRVSNALATNSGATQAVTA